MLRRSTSSDNLLDTAPTLLSCSELRCDNASISLRSWPTAICSFFISEARSAQEEICSVKRFVKDPTSSVFLPTLEFIFWVSKRRLADTDRIASAFLSAAIYKADSEADTLLISPCIAVEAVSSFSSNVPCLTACAAHLWDNDSVSSAALAAAERIFWFSASSSAKRDSKSLALFPTVMCSFFVSEVTLIDIAVTSAAVLSFSAESASSMVWSSCSCSEDRRPAVASTCSMRRLASESNLADTADNFVPCCEILSPSSQPISFCQAFCRAVCCREASATSPASCSVPASISLTLAEMPELNVSTSSLNSCIAPASRALARFCVRDSTSCTMPSVLSASSRIRAVQMLS